MILRRFFVSLSKKPLSHALVLTAADTSSPLHSIETTAWHVGVIHPLACMNLSRRSFMRWRMKRVLLFCFVTFCKAAQQEVQCQNQETHRSFATMAVRLQALIASPLMQTWQEHVRVRINQNISPKACSNIKEILSCSDISKEEKASVLERLFQVCAEIEFSEHATLTAMFKELAMLKKTGVVMYSIFDSCHNCPEVQSDIIIIRDGAQSFLEDFVLTALRSKVLQRRSSTERS